MSEDRNHRGGSRRAVTSAILGPRTIGHLESRLAADTVLTADTRAALDKIVAPGVDLAPEKHDTPPALAGPSLRRRP